MKNHQLIVLTTTLFVVLFYQENIGLNLGILGIAYAILTLIKTPNGFKTKTFFMLFVTSVLSSVAFAWFGDFPSFLAIVTSLFLFTFTSKSKELKTLFFILVFAYNFLTFFVRVFRFEDWLPKKKTSEIWQKLIAIMVIPSLFIAVFFRIYSSGSDYFAHFFAHFSWDFNLWQFFVLSCIGFFIAFNYWNFENPDFIYKQNHFLKNDFLQQDKLAKRTWSFMDLNAERTSGVVTLLALNVLLLFFIFTYNFEQFYQVPKSPNQLSTETHDRVNSVIFSILMAIVVILFYFKSHFNFDKKADFLKILAKIWIFLNAVLVISATLKNAEYIINFGLTYKRLGVFAFLGLSLVGLVITFIKIWQKKTNAFLFNHMFWYFYATILACSYFNWGSLITKENLSRKNYDFDYLLHQVHFNEKQLQEFSEKENKASLQLFINESINPQIKENKNKPFLSKILYYESIK